MLGSILGDIIGSTYEFANTKMNTMNLLSEFFQRNSHRLGTQELNEVISRLMDAGKAFFCRIVSTNRKHKWVKIDAKIFMVE